jgi:mRNA interferase RelE/StbE
MVWRVNFDQAAEKELSKLDKPVAIRILKFLNEKIVPSKNPRILGEPLKGSLSEYWKYRIGDYRVVCYIADEIVTVRVIRIAHRRHVYK